MPPHMQKKKGNELQIPLETLLDALKTLKRKSWASSKTIFAMAHNDPTHIIAIYANENNTVFL